jgi:glycosyltransferase involved in cell wall biosynthesis
VEFVSIVIPAYNAAATIDETLISVRAQSHTNLEIIVVDDGSTDGTAAIVKRHAADDRRITLVSQANAGVAAARNHGWARATSDLIAFVDADDLFAPTKIERQVAALAAGGDSIGLVYVYHARIDAESNIIEHCLPHPAEGYVLDEVMRYNFIGNGSSALVRRAALIQANGFESGLRAADAQGCEDFLFYCRVAEAFKFARVPEFLLGYRELPNNMSSNVPRMLRSYCMVIEEMSSKYPEKRPIIQHGLYYYAKWLSQRAIYGRQPGRIAPVLSSLMRHQPKVACVLVVRGFPGLAYGAARDLVRLLGRKLRGEVKSGEPLGRFAIGYLSVRAEVAEP